MHTLGFQEMPNVRFWVFLSKPFLLLSLFHTIIAVVVVNVSFKSIYMTVLGLFITQVKRQINK